MNIGDNGIESKEDIREKVSRQAENKEDRTENDNISANRSKGPNRGQSKVLNNFSNSNYLHLPHYILYKSEDVEQFKKDLEIMPKSRNENMHEQSREDSRGN